MRITSASLPGLLETLARSSRSWSAISPWSKMDPAGVLVNFGLFKIFAGLYFKTPVPDSTP